MPHNRLIKTLVAAALACAVAAPAAAQVDDRWRFNAILYGYFPDIGGSTSFPAGTGSNINVDASTLISNLKFTFMGTFEAQKGRWGFFTDVIYLDVGGSNTSTRDVTVGGGLPAGVTANLDYDLKGVTWTLAGTYRVVSDPAANVDILAGARLLDLRQTLGYNFSADVGGIVGPGRSGTSEVDVSYWDAVVGVKGRYAFGARREWFVPYYADVGTGDSDLTWQVFGGLGYQFSWGSVLGGWRYLDYSFKSSSKVQDLTFNGPMLGVAFRW